MSEQNFEPLETARWLAQVLNVSTATVYRLRREGRHNELPPCVLVGQSPRWQPSTVKMWLETREGKINEAA